MPTLDLIRPSVTATHVTASVNNGFARELRLSPHVCSPELITTDSDDVACTAVDEATRQTMVEAVYGCSLYAGAAHSFPSTSGEVLIMLGGPNPTEVRASLDVMVIGIENRVVSQRANNAEDIALLAHVVLRTGSYLSTTTGCRLGDPMAYLVVPPLEAAFGTDVALESADIQLMTYVPPPPETNYSATFSTGNQAACKATYDAFTNAVLDTARSPIQRI